jgi:hypothetical protein
MRATKAALAVGVPLELADQPGRLDDAALGAHRTAHEARVHVHGDDGPVEDRGIHLHEEAQALELRVAERGEVPYAAHQREVLLVT